MFYFLCERIDDSIFRFVIVQKLFKLSAINQFRIFVSFFHVISVYGNNLQFKGFHFMSSLCLTNFNPVLFNT